MSRAFLSLVLTLALSGCGSLLNPYQENFKCRTPDDSGACVDVPTAYGHATGALSLTEECPGCAAQASPASPAGRNAYLEAQYSRLAGLLAEPETPVLTPPKVMRGLILAYPGTGSELFMPRYIYFKVDDGNWVFGEEKKHLQEERP